MTVLKGMKVNGATRCRFMCTFASRLKSTVLNYVTLFVGGMLFNRITRLFKDEGRVEKSAYIRQQTMVGAGSNMEIKHVRLHNKTVQL